MSADELIGAQMILQITTTGRDETPMQTAPKDTLRLGLQGVSMIAHRGVSGLERENTCAAFVAAGNRSYYGIETDIHRTADGRYIVVHDDDLRRVAGLEHVIEETDFDVLRSVRLTDMDGRERFDLALPSLEEYIRICRKYDKESVLEIKNPFEPADIENVIAAIRGLDWLDRTTFISFELSNLICIRELLPQQRAQYLVRTFDGGLIDLLRAHRLDLDIRHTAVDAQAVRACHDAGIRVNVWTVDDAQEARRLAECGVDYITTNILE